MTRHALFLVTVAFVVTLVGASCQPTNAVDVGALLFADPRLSTSDFNAVSCATCHNIDDGDDSGGERIVPGHPMRDVAFRPSWWGGNANSLKDAVDLCLVFFMREAPLEATSPQSRALYEYLLSVSPTRPAEALPLTVVENVASLPRGDSRRGAVVYDAACKSCHGDAFTGLGRLSELISIVPDDSVPFAEESGFPLSVVLIEKVRHGPFFGIGGTMPPFSVERLSDEDLSALIGFLDPI
jgi:thiosulfate dehydrogenase